MHLRPDRTYGAFWRQGGRWLGRPAGDPVQLTLPAASTPGDTLPLRIVVRNASFEPVADAVVDVRVSAPDGRMEQLRAAAVRGTSDGTFETAYRPADPGVYRVTAEARRGDSALGSATASMLVGGADFEMTDPRPNTPLLQRIAIASGARMVAADDIPTPPTVCGRGACRRAGGEPRSLEHLMVLPGHRHAAVAEWLGGVGGDFDEEVFVPGAGRVHPRSRRAFASAGERYALIVSARAAAAALEACVMARSSRAVRERMKFVPATLWCSKRRDRAPPVQLQPTCVAP